MLNDVHPPFEPQVVSAKMRLRLTGPESGLCCRVAPRYQRTPTVDQRSCQWRWCRVPRGGFGAPVASETCRAGENTSARRCVHSSVCVSGARATKQSGGRKRCAGVRP